MQPPSRSQHDLPPSTSTASAIAPASTGHPAMRTLNLAAFVLACLVAFAFGFTPLRTSHDEFWHVKTGQWIAQHGLPKNDIFTSTAQHLPWHNHEWLTQVAMWKIYDWGEAADFGGWRAVILAKSLLVVLAFVGFAMLLARPMRQPLWAALAAALVAALARRTFFPRPPVVTNVLLALTFWMLIEWRAGRLRQRWLWLLVPLFALWSNLHGGWLAGLIFLGAFWTESLFLVLVLVFRNRNRTNQSIPHSAIRIPHSFFFLSALGLACAAATLANPFGYHLYELTLRVMFEDQYLLARIGEMLPPHFYFVRIAEGVILTLAACAVRPVRLHGFVLTALLIGAIHVLLHRLLPPLPPADPPAELLKAYAWLYSAVALPAFIAAVIRLRPPGALAHILIGCFFLLQGLHHVRHLLLTALAILPVLAWSLEGWATAFAARDTHPPRREALASALGVVALITLTAFWLFSREGWLSYADRNRMLTGGWRGMPSLQFQPATVVADGIQWPAPSTLPRQGVYMIDAYPVKAVDFMLRAALPAPLWNGGNYAGYLIWRLSPEKYKVWTDNRYDIYGGLVIREEHSVINGYTREELARSNPEYFKGPTPPPWNEVLDKYRIQTVFIPADAPVNARLASSGAWVRVWEDFDFNIWVRGTPQNKSAIDRAQSLPRPQTATRVY